MMKIHLKDKTQSLVLRQTQHYLLDKQILWKDKELMAQHFLLSAKAKTLSIAKLALMSEKECEQYLRALRWANNGGKPVCDKCGGVKCSMDKGQNAL